MCIYKTNNIFVNQQDSYPIFLNNETIWLVSMVFKIRKERLISTLTECMVLQQRERRERKAHLGRNRMFVPKCAFVGAGNVQLLITCRMFHS